MLLLTPIFCLIMVLECGTHAKPLPPIPAPINPPKPNPQPMPPPPPVPPQPDKPLPGSKVNWTEFKAQRNESNPAWGDYLTDIVNHLPQSFGTQYRYPDDKNTWAHETSHGICSHLCNTLNTSGRDMFYLYVGYNKAVGIKQPNVKISQVAALVPYTLQKSRFNLYLIDQRKYFEDDPIYLFDEWVAYCNGLECSIEVYNKKLENPNKSDVALSVVEFNVYVAYVIIAQKKHDPNYDNKQLFEFTAWNMKRAMKLYHEAYQHDVFNWDKDEYLDFLRTDASASEFRTFIIDSYGADWAKEVFGFTKK